MSIAALETPRTFTPEDIDGEINHFPEPGWFRKRDQSYFEPDWDDPKLKEVFDTEDKRLQLQMLIDPVKWAEKEIKIVEPLTEKVVPFKARWYQQLLLQARDRYQVWRLGRQVGKTISLCIIALWYAFTHANSHVLIMAPYDEQVKRIFWDRPGIEFMISNSDTLRSSQVGNITKSPPYRVHFNNGSSIVGMSLVAGSLIVTIQGIKKIEDIKEGDEVWAKQEDGSMAFSKVTEVLIPNFKKIYDLELEDGRLVRISEDHPLWTGSQWVKLKDLSVGDTVFSPGRYDFDYEDIKYTDDLISTVAYMIGDGGFTDGMSFTVHKDNVELKKDFDRLLEKQHIFFRMEPMRENNCHEYKIYCWKAYKTETEFYKKVKALGLSGKHSREKRVPLEFMGMSDRQIALFLNKLFATDGYYSKRYVGFSSTSPGLVRDVQHLLLRLGIVSRIRFKPGGRECTIRGKTFIQSDCYELQILRSWAIQKFIKEIGIFGKDSHIVRVPMRDVISADEFTDKLYEILKARPRGAFRKSRRAGVWGSLFKRKKGGWMDVHTARSIAYKVESQELLDLVNTSTEVSSPLIPLKIRSIVYSGMETTYDIEVAKGNCFVANDILLHNTAGTRSGAGGGAARGARADLILLDEADYLEDKDLTTILGIRVGRPNVRIIASSTPRGQRGIWHKWNHDPTWKTFHWPSSVVPYWDQISEIWSDALGRFLRVGELIVGEYDEYGLITEILAEFPEELSGVFQKYYLDIMFGDDKILEEMGEKNYSDYTYPRKPNFRTNKRIMGVDVDKYQTGPEIVIIEHNDQLNKTFILERITLPKGKKGELTLVNLVDKIIDLQSGWKCSHIYVDRGFGEMVVENLHLYGKTNPDTKLDKIVHGIFSGESIEIPDPARSGLKTKQPLKPYLVNNVVRYTERCQLVASRFDIKLKRQMEGYQVVASSSVSGQPRYTSKNEHVLDAMGFALYGMVYHFGRELAFPRGGHGVVLRKTTEGKLAPTPKNRNTNLSGRGNRYITTTTNRASALRGVSGRRGAWTSHRTRRGF